MINEKYIEIYKGDINQKRKIIKDEDNNNFIENILFNICKEKIIYNKENINKINNIFLGIFIIKYQNDLRTDLFNKIELKYKIEYLNLLDFIIFNFEKFSLIQQEISLLFLNLNFMHFDIDFIYKEIYKYNSIFIWIHLSQSSIINYLKKDNNLIKNFLALSNFTKKDNGKTLKSKNCNFTNDLIEYFINLFENNFDINYSNLYCQFINLLINILSVNTMRKFVLPLLIEKHFLERINIIMNKNSNISKNFKEIYKNLKFYYLFEFDNIDEKYIDKLTYLSNLDKKFQNFEKIGFNFYPDEFNYLITNKVSLKNNRENLNNYLNLLKEDKIYNLLNYLNLLFYPKKFYNFELLSEIFYINFENNENLFENKIFSLPILPNNQTIFNNENLIPLNYSFYDFNPLPIPQLNLTYLTLYDYLLKQFYLFKYESSYEIREDIEDCIDQLNPNFEKNENKKFISFQNFSPNSIKINNFQLINVKENDLGNEYPNEIIAEIEIDLNETENEYKKNWDKLKKYDIIFLIYFYNEKMENNFIRAGEIKSIYDEKNNNILNYDENNINEYYGNKRKIQILLDPIQYTNDLKEGLFINYNNFNLCIKRESKENNFKPILENIKHFIENGNNFTNFPKWIEIIILNYFQLQNNNYNFQLEINDNNFDFYDTFINEKQLKNFKDKFNIRNVICSHLNNPFNNINFNLEQLNAIYYSIHNKLTLIYGPPGTGKTDVAVQIINLLHQNYKHEKILIITHSNNALNNIFEKLLKLNINQKYLLRLGIGNKYINNEEDFSIKGRIKHILKNREIILKKFLEICYKLNINIYQEYTCSTALIIINNFILNNPTNIDIIKNEFNIDINDFIMEIKEYQNFEIIRDNLQRKNFLINNYSKIIAMTSTYAGINKKNLLDIDFSYSNIIIEEAGELLDIETFIPLTLQNNLNKLKRLILVGDIYQLPPIIKSSALKTYSNYDQSLFSRLIKNKFKYIKLEYQNRAKKNIVNLYRWKYPFLKDNEELIKNKFNYINKGFKYNTQFINVENYEGKGEVLNNNFSYYNLAEAEYCIALYIYMCLKGYKPEQISIITPYNGQKNLIKEIYSKKCIANIFQGIKKITTVDNYQGQQNDYIILSLVRTKEIGYLRDIRRFIVSISRARFGLYIIGRWNLFYNWYEMKETFDILNKIEKDLILKINENINDKKAENIETKIEDFNHLYSIDNELYNISYK